MPSVVFPNQWLEQEYLNGHFHGGGTEPWTLGVVASILLATGARHVLEIGTFRGHASVWLSGWLEVTGGGSFTGVDIDPARAAATLAVLEEQKYKSVKVQVSCDNSLEFLRASDKHSWDFVWLDGSHEKDHVAEELRWLLDEERLAPRGTVCMHDVIGPFGLGDLCAERHGAVLSFPQIHAAGGLGVIQV